MKHLNVFIPATEAEVSDAESRCDGLLPPHQECLCRARRP